MLPPGGDALGGGCSILVRILSVGALLSSGEDALGGSIAPIY